ncbi:MAG: acyl-CoA dehydratase activase [Bacillota bacterium]
MICGIDLGSRQVKIAVMENDNIVKVQCYDTILFYKEFAAKKADELVIDFANLDIPTCKHFVSTGYGRLTVKVTGSKTLPEIKAHYLGALFQCGLKDFTLVDLGGQDSKIIKVRDEKIVDFITNDKCAASSGRYLENMAQVLGISLDELSKHYEDPVELSSTCAVFGESELIGKIVEGYSLASLAAGVNYSIFRRIRPLLLKIGSERIVFTGGVARSKALIEIIKKECGGHVIVPPMPLFNGAIGCCVYAKNTFDGLC